MNKLYIMDAEDCLNQIETNSIQIVYIDPPYNTLSKKFEYYDHYEDWDSFISSKLKKHIQFYKKQESCSFLLMIIN